MELHKSALYVYFCNSMQLKTICPDGGRGSFYVTVGLAMNEKITAYCNVVKSFAFWKGIVSHCEQPPHFSKVQM